jgi:hypothetical protein
MMAGFLPGIELRLHDVAIHAGFGIFAEIREPFSVSKGKNSDAGKNSN